MRTAQGVGQRRIGRRDGLGGGHVDQVFGAQPGALDQEAQHCDGDFAPHERIVQVDLDVAGAVVPELPARGDDTVLRAHRDDTRPDDFDVGHVQRLR